LQSTLVFVVTALLSTAALPQPLNDGSNVIGNAPGGDTTCFKNEFGRLYNTKRSLCDETEGERDWNISRNDLSKQLYNYPST
jgi:hypothetical protein